MKEHFVWMTTRKIKPGTLTDFERAWRPDTHPEGMLRAYAYWSADEREIIGVSFWGSQELCQAWRSSAAEARRWCQAIRAGLPPGRRHRLPRQPAPQAWHTCASALPAPLLCFCARVGGDRGSSHKYPPSLATERTDLPRMVPAAAGPSVAGAAAGSGAGRMDSGYPFSTGLCGVRVLADGEIIL